MMFCKKITVIVLLLSTFVYGQSLSLPYKDVAGWMLVEVKINEQPLTLLFDTGWDGIAFKAELFEDFSPQQDLLVKDANNVLQKVPTYIVDSLRIEDIIYKKVPVTDFSSFAMVSDPIFECYNIDGVLGNVFFAEKILEIDPLNKTIYLHDFSTALYQRLQDQQFKVLPNIASLQSDRIVVPLEINQNSMPFVFDTGDTGRLSIATPVASSDLFSAAPLDLYYGIGNVSAFGLDKNINQIVIDHSAVIRLGEHTYTQFELTFTTGEPYFQMGVEFIKNFQWIYDPFTRQVFYKDTQVTPSISTLSKLNFGIAFIEGAYRIGAVGVDEQRVSLGDVVLKIDGIAMQDLCDYRAYIRNKNNVLYLEIAREDQIMNIEISLP